jgi:hypothetical protein
MWHQLFFYGTKATRDIIIGKYFEQKMDKVDIYKHLLEDEITPKFTKFLLF